MGECPLYLNFADKDFTKATFNIFQCERITFSFLIIWRQIMATIGARVVSPHPSLFQLKLQHDTGVIKSTVILNYYEPETPFP